MGARDLLILGASGFLGPHLVREAQRVGWTVRVTSRRPEGESRSWISPHVARHRWDAQDSGGLARLWEEARPSAVLLAAALSQVGECERDPLRAERLNRELPGEAARMARAHGARLVHLSTDLVFGGEPPRAERFDEEDPPAPLHAYGRTKAAGEARVLAEFPEALVVRLPLLYGDSGGRGLGATDQIRARLERGERPALFTDEWRTPLEVSNAARALVELVGLEQGGLLHVAGPERLSRFDLGLAWLLASGAEREGARARLQASLRADLGLAEQRPADVSLDASRASAILTTPLLAPEVALKSTLP